jgi:RNA polymerase sigma-70 factor (ECF subfamily)
VVSPDDELLERARAGDRAAIEGLLERHQAQIYRFGLRMCGNPEDAQDVLQDTLLAMARTVRDFRGASSLSTWLYTIARRFCIKKRRRSNLAPPRVGTLDDEVTASGSTLADPARAPDEALAVLELEAALDRAIASLPQGHQDVLVLRDVEGLTAPEVAQVLGITVQAVKSRLHRARRAVRLRLEPAIGPSAAAAAPCPDVLLLFSRHLENDIDADACAEMERHLERCDRCRATCDSLRRTLALCRTAGRSLVVPPAVQASVKAALRGLVADAT